MPRQVARRAAGPPGKSDVGAGGTVLESPRVAVSACVQASSNRSFFSFFSPLEREGVIWYAKLCGMPFRPSLLLMMCLLMLLRQRARRERKPSPLATHPHFEFGIIPRITNSYYHNFRQSGRGAPHGHVHFRHRALSRPRCPPTTTTAHAHTHTPQTNKQKKILVTQEANEEPWRQYYMESKQP